MPVNTNAADQNAINVIGTATCSCTGGYSGEDCATKPICPDGCSGHGVCVPGVVLANGVLSSAQCFCDVGWASSLPSVNNCARNMLGCTNNCSFQGDCVNKQCLCYDGFAGSDCSQQYFDATMKGEFGGPLTGGTTVVFLVNGWLNALQNQAFTERDITCQFGDVPASSISYDPRSRTVRCVSPPAPVGSVPLSLGINAQRWRGKLPFQKLFSFVYRGEPAILAIVPSYAPSSGSGTITVVGVNFGRNILATNQFVCKFGSGLTAFQLPGTWRDDNRVVCQTPPSVSPSLPVEISIDQGRSFTSSGTSGVNVLTLYGLARVVPSCAAASGVPVELTLTGVALSTGSSDYVCRARTLNNKESWAFSGKWDAGNSAVKCTFPGSTTAVDQLLIEVSLDGGNSYSTSLNTYIKLFAAPQLTFATPQLGSTAGGTFVTVSGSNFPICCPSIASSDSGVCTQSQQVVSCRFGTSVVPGYLSNDLKSVVCLSPQTPYPGWVGVALAFNSEQYSLSTARYMYHPPVQVSRLEPASGYFGVDTTKVAVYGTNFINAPDARCVFYFGSSAGTSIVVPTAAYFVSQTQFLCDAPRWADTNTPSATVEIMLAAEPSTSSPPVKFFYVNKPDVKAIQPGFAPVEGGSIITVTGAGFSTGTAAKCRFALTGPSPGAEVPATIVSDTALTCIVPAVTSVDACSVLPGSADAAQPRGISQSGSVEVTLNGRTYFPSLQKLSYFTLSGPVNPTLGPVAGGTKVTVYLNGALTGGQTVPPVKCIFAANSTTSVQVDGTAVSDSTRVTSVSCPAKNPAGSEAGVVQLRLQFAHQLSTTAGSFGDGIDVKVSALTALQTLIAYRQSLKSVESVSPAATLNENLQTKSLSSVKSLLSPTLTMISDLNTEFGTTMFGASAAVFGDSSAPTIAQAQAQLLDVASQLDGAYSKLGATTTGLLDVTFSKLMATGFGSKEARKYLTSTYGIPPGLVDAILLSLLLNAPTSQLTTVAASQSFVDQAVSAFASTKGITLALKTVSVAFQFVSPTATKDVASALVTGDGPIALVQFTGVSNAVQTLTSASCRLTGVTAVPGVPVVQFTSGVAYVDAANKIASCLFTSLSPGAGALTASLSLNGVDYGNEIAVTQVAAPTLTSVLPAVAVSGAATTITLTGKFTKTPKSWCYWLDNDTGLRATTEATYVSGTSMTCLTPTLVPSLGNRVATTETLGGVSSL